MPLLHLENSPSLELPFLKEIGALSVTWNMATHAVYAMFVGFSGMKAPLAAKAYYSLKADSAQRDMTKAIAEYVLTGRGKDMDLALLERTKQAFNRLTNFATVRNGAIHGVFMADANGLLAVDPDNQSTANQRKHDLFRNPAKIQSELEAILTELVAVVNDCAAHLAWPDTLLR